MYRPIKPRRSSMRINKGYEGERIEEKVHRIVNNKEPIKDGAPLIYTERKDGVKPEYDIRADKFEIAVEAMDKVAEQHHTDRKKRFEAKLDKANKDKTKEVGGQKTDPNQGKSEPNGGNSGDTSGGGEKGE